MRRWRFPSSITAAAIALVLLCWGDSFVEPVDARQTASTRMASYGAGPVALGVQQGDEAVVLQADGQAYSLNMTTGVIGPRVYRVPASYQAVDVAAGRVRGILVTCFSVNPRSSKDGRSFVLQVAPDKREVWTWLRVPGIYVGLAIDPARGVAYAANSTTNEIYAVTVGNQNIAPTRVVAIPGAVRLGALAIAPGARRLYAADMGAPRIYTIDLATGAVRAVDVRVEEIRAMSWDGPRKRLFIADSGHETILVVDLNTPAPKVERVVSDKRLRDPAGLAVGPDGTVWVADEAGRSIFQLSADTRSITRALRWAPPAPAAR
jgi:sugar lactone lactonase YvrE